jgi:hypothetical protein
VTVKGLLPEELDDELLVYDEQRHTACRLNRTAALVWQHADGERSIAQLVELLQVEVESADEDLVLVTLDRLYEQGLIESGYAGRDPDEARLSRRRFIRKVGVVGTAALALPVVQNVVAPTAAAAQSVCQCREACYCPCHPPSGCYPCYCSCACETCVGKTCAGSCACDYCYCYCSTCSCAAVRPSTRGFRSFG